MSTPVCNRLLLASGLLLFLWASAVTPSLAADVSVLTNIRSTLEGESFEAARAIGACSDLFEAGTRVPHVNTANNCTDAVKTASRRGWVGHLPLTLLALQQEPLVKDGKGSDSAAYKALKIVEGIFDLDKVPEDDKAPVSYICTNGRKTCLSQPVTGMEYVYALMGYKGLTPQMNSDRAIPVSKPLAAMLAYADAQMNMDRYLDDGKTLQQTVERILTKNKITYLNIENTFKLCVTNNPIPETKSWCAINGARFGLVDALQSGARYNGIEFVGTQDAKSVGATTSTIQR
jgi:hypothetical protein